MWNIRKHVKKGDYVYALVPEHPNATKNGYVLLHRVVMENKIGRLLADNEVVHHKDDNKKNNSEDNLEIKDKIEHLKYHARKRFPNGRTTEKFICRNCGREFERELRYSSSRKGYKNTFCSSKCNGIYNGFKHKPL